MGTSLTHDLDRLRKLKTAATAATAKAKKLSTEATEYELKLFARMEESDLESIKFRGVNFVRAETAYGQVQDRSEFIRWALQNDEQLIEHKERKALVNELVREKLDNGEPLPPGLGFYVKQYIGQRGASNGET